MSDIEQKVVVHELIQLISVQPRPLLEWMWGDIEYTERTPDIWRDLCCSGIEGGRIVRVPLAMAKQFHAYMERVPNSIHILYPPGDNYAIVIDWKSWLACEFHRKRAILETKRDSAGLAINVLRDHRFMRMSVAIAKEIGRRIPTDWFNHMYTKGGEESVKHEVDTLSSILSRDLYISPDGEELETASNSQIIIETHEQQTTETSQPIQ